MKKSCALFLALMLVFALPAGGESVFRHRLNPKRTPGLAEFQAAHPELRLEVDETQYDDWGRMSASLITGQVQSDVFALSTFSDDYAQVFAKGYSLDLSGSHELAAMVARMHQSIQAQVIKEGRLYALPVSLMFSYSIIDPGAFAEAGLTTADIPRSFPALLDFLDAWCLRQESGASLPIRVRSNWVPELYGPGSYTAWLTALLIDSHILQQEHARQPLRFHTPELLALLTRIQQVGARIYRMEPPPGNQGTGEGLGLMNETSAGDFTSRWPKQADNLMFLPVNDSQPRLLAAALNMQVVNARSAFPEAGTALLVSLGQFAREDQKVFLYRDAAPLINPNYEQNIAIIQNNITKTEEALNNSKLTMSDRQDLENQLRTYQLMLTENQADERKYLMTATQLKDYAALAADFVFLKPGYFSFGKDRYYLSQTIDRFAAGQLSAEGLLQELDRVVRMMAQEGGG